MLIKNNYQILFEIWSYLNKCSENFVPSYSKMNLQLT